MTLDPLRDPIEDRSESPAWYDRTIPEDTREWNNNDAWVSDDVSS